MKSIFIATALTFASLTTWAVSIEFPSYSAVEIGDIETTSTAEYTETTVGFSGAGLLPLYDLLPEVFDIETNKNSETLRGFDIFNVSKDGISKKINFQCIKESTPASAKCRVTITKGVIAG